MPALRFEYSILMEDEVAYEVVTDQRDIAAWEVQSFSVPFNRIGERIHLFMRWTSWHALKERYGTITMTWEEFDKKCVEVSDLDADSADPGSVDPTGQDQSAGA